MGWFRLLVALLPASLWAVAVRSLEGSSSALHASSSAPLRVSLNVVEVSDGWPHGVEADMRLIAGTSAGVQIEWDPNVTYFEPEDFLRDFLPRANASTLVYITAKTLLNMTTDEEYCGTAKNSLLSSSIAQALLAHPRPLQLVLDDSCCQVAEWPSSSRHALYRKAFSRDLHFRLTPQNSMRSMPYGSFPRKEVLHTSGLRSDARRLLLSFSGSNSGLFTPGARCGALHALHARREAIDSLAAAAMIGKPLLEDSPPLGSRRVYAHLRPSENPKLANCSDEGAVWGEANLSYTTLLSHSVFGLAPPGDFWESYRLWELIEAGVIPIVQRTKGVYSGCDDAAYHVLHTIDGVLAVDDYSQLPELLQLWLGRGWDAINDLQARLLASYNAERQRVRREVAEFTARHADE
ncbi:hypothetical protein AB1Y20_022777 [Prymnesium parvum]|uniref:RXYLT1 C-terminal domain-containing protein n=1 Tax=Prymnesium parvum TaxID=97485 RepID=A0AB34JJS6_PRYPA